jgi:HNH endonuclease
MSKTPPPTLISMTLIVVTRVLERLQESLRNAQPQDPSEQPYDHDPLMRRPQIITDIPEPVGERHRRVIPQAVKIAVSARDGGRCRKCGSTQQLHFDHVIPVSRGGANTVANIQLLCGPCNRAKGASTPVT